LPLASLLLSKPTVFPIGLPVLRLDVSAEVGTVDLNLAAQLRLVRIVTCEAIASRSLCNETKLLLGLMLRSRLICSADVPFTPFTKSAITAR
jgi:hypothetical protein